MNDISKKYYVYVHIDILNNKVFYVGKGKDDRAYSTHRNLFWKEKVSELNGNFKVEIIKDNLTNDEALKIEFDTIQKLGLENLTNIMPGGDEQFWGLSVSDLILKNPEFQRLWRDLNIVNDESLSKEKILELVSSETKSRLNEPISEELQEYFDFISSISNPSESLKKKLINKFQKIRINLCERMQELEEDCEDYDDNYLDESDLFFELDCALEYQNFVDEYDGDEIQDDIHYINDYDNNELSYEDFAGFIYDDRKSINDELTKFNSNDFNGNSDELIKIGNELINLYNELLIDLSK